MKIREISNTTKEEINSKKYNIFIGICLGNKFFLKGSMINEKNIIAYLNFALKYTKEKVLFLVADKIQAINYNVRNHNPRRYNIRRVLRDGKKIKSALEILMKKLSKSEQNKIKIIQWEEYTKEDALCSDTTNLIYKEFKNNKEFKDYVLNVVKTSVTDRKFNEEEYLELCNYLLDEFSLVYSGIRYHQDYYGLFIYPEIDSAGYFIEKLQKGEIFPKLNKKLPIEKVALAILN